MAKPLDRVKLTKLLGLLGSNHDGEVVAAARAAQRLVKDAGMQWEDVLFFGPPRTVRVPAAPNEAPSYHALARKILDSGYRLEPREEEFILDMLRRRKPITENQERWLKLIAVKAKVL
jgi:hypothetical protein